MIEITAAAQEKLLQLWAAKRDSHRGLYVAIAGRSATDFQYTVRFINQTEELDCETVTDIDDLRVYVDREDIDRLKGSTIDFLPFGRGFSIENPNSVWSWSDPLAQAVQDVLTKSINPQIAAHGGSVQLLDVKDNVAYIQMGGGCVGCGMVDVTLKQGVEVAIKAAVPQVVSIVDTTDHASGTNPYFQEAKGGGHHQPAKGGDPHHQPAKGGEEPRSPFAR